MAEPRPRVELFDTTLRDGAQTSGVHFSVEDKLRIAERLDLLGIDYIEGGWPGSNPKDLAFFERIRSRPPKHSKIVAFGSTRRAGVTCEDDFNIRALLGAQTDVVCIVAKSWDFHVTHALGIALEENIEIVRDSVAFLRKAGKRIFLDAEHFFDGYKANPKHALDVLRAAAEAGAEVLVLCDTNGGTLTADIDRIVGEVMAAVKTPLGIHCHNDSELAVANSLAAVTRGVRHVQGTLNGLGERCGNANLCSIAPNLLLKMGYDCLGPGMLEHLTPASRFLDEVLNRQPWAHQPFVGSSAFAHKGGLHASAILKDSRTYEHIRPELVGNRQLVLVSDQSGQANIRAKAQEMGIALPDRDVTARILEKVKQLESEGYSYEGAEASFELLIREAMAARRTYYELIEYHVFESKRAGDLLPQSEGTVKIKVGGHVFHTASGGDGPVNALDRALRQALASAYPAIAEIELLDYKVRVLDSDLSGTASLVRVLVESGAGGRRWGTVGVSPNIIDASWHALTDAIDHYLHTRGIQAADADVPNAVIHFR